MAIERKSRGPNSQYYHFVLYKNNGDRKYYHTAQQIADDIGMCRSTIYRCLRKKNHILGDWGVLKKDYLHVSVVEHLVDQEVQRPS
jgi:hypothetical protein